MSSQGNWCSEPVPEAGTRMRCHRTVQENPGNTCELFLQVIPIGRLQKISNANARFKTIDRFWCTQHRFEMIFGFYRSFRTRIRAVRKIKTCSESFEFPIRFCPEGERKVGGCISTCQQAPAGWQDTTSSNGQFQAEFLNFRSNMEKKILRARKWAAGRVRKSADDFIGFHQLRSPRCRGLFPCFNLFGQEQRESGY